MSRCSFIVHARPGSRADLHRMLGDVPGCSVTPADRGDRWLVVTDPSCIEDSTRIRARLVASGTVQALIDRHER